MAEPNLTELARRLRPLLMPAMSMVSATVVEGETVSVLAGTGLTGGGLLDQDRTLSIDLAGNLTWTGAQTFQGQTTARNILPEATDQYDLGSSLKLWRKGWLSELDAVVFAQNTVTLIGGWLVVGKGEGTLPADVASGATSIDFGQAMTVGDFVLMRAAGKVEYLSVGSLVSGTTYNVTRNLDGTGANDWPAGTPYAILGQSGAGRIELNAYDTPRISILRQGATYNAVTEPVRIGDLNGWDDVGTERYGIGLGDYAGGNYLRYEPGAGFSLKAGGGSVSIDDGGIAIEAADDYEPARTIEFFPTGSTDKIGDFWGSHSVDSYVNQMVLRSFSPDSISGSNISLTSYDAGSAGGSRSKVNLSVSAGFDASYIDMDQDQITLAAVSGGVIYIEPVGSALSVMYLQAFTGWQKDWLTWTYGSATTFTVPGDQRDRLKKGTKICLTQPTLGVKYFNVIGVPVYSSPNTTVSIFGGSDYTLANEAITSPMYSYEATPQGFPDWFNWTITWGGFSTDPSNVISRFRVDGRQVTAVVRTVTLGTSNANTLTLTAPIISANITNATWFAGVIGHDNGAILAAMARLSIGANTTTINAYPTQSSSSLWTTSGTKAIFGTLIYEF